MNCTNCAFATKIKEADHGSIRYEDTPCASCKLTEDSSRTLEYVEGQAAGPMRWPPAAETAGSDVLPLSVLAEAMREFLELPPRTFRILQRRRNGDSYALIAQELEVTPQAVEVQLRRALDAHPHLKNLLPEKARRQAARKRKRLSMARRGKMGSL